MTTDARSWTPPSEPVSETLHSVRRLRKRLPVSGVSSIAHYAPDWRFGPAHGLPLRPGTRSRCTGFCDGWAVLDGLTVLRGRRPSTRRSEHLPSDATLACAGIAVKRAR